jgi:hypothetical protein
MSPIRLSTLAGYPAAMARWLWCGAILSVALAACSPDAQVTTTSSPVPPDAITTTTTAPGTDPCISGGLPFSSEGLIASLGETNSDATRISEIRWDPTATCERITMAFATESGAPATTLGLTGVTAFTFTGSLRVTLPPDVTATAVADSLLDGDLIQRLYVVRGSARDLFVDIIGVPGEPIAARAFLTTSPATLVIDVVPAPDAPAPGPVAHSDAAVIVSPPQGPALYPVTVEAYAAPSLRTVRIQVTNDEIVAIDRALALTGDSDAWQAISTRIEDGPAGRSTLFVGTVDPNARQLEGATVVLDLP